MIRELDILEQQILCNLNRVDVDLMTPSEILKEIADCISDTRRIIEAQDLTPKEPS